MDYIDSRALQFSGVCSEAVSRVNILLEGCAPPRYASLIRAFRGKRNIALAESAIGSM